jgi:hypothetical protein
MRYNTFFTAIVLYLASLAFAQPPSGDWSGETTITVTSSYSTTLTVTKYLTYANATTTSGRYTSTGWNATTSHASAPTSHKATTVAAASTSSVFPPIASATGAASALDINLAVAGFAGMVAVFMGSL